MNTSELTKYLVEGLLGENAKKKVAVYAGAFRPPTKSDYELLEKAIEEDPGVDEIHVYVGDAESEGLDQDQAVQIWQMFGEHFPRDFYVHKSAKSPVSDVYAYTNKFPTYDISWLFGVQAGNSDDFKEIADRTKDVGKFDNLEIKPVVYDQKITDRQVAAAAAMGTDELEKFLPKNLTYKEIDTISNMLKPKKLDEAMHQYPDDIINKITEEGWEYYETMGSLASKAAKVAKQARKENKKLFTLAYERDSSSDPLIQYINVFWADGGDPSRDVIEGGTMQDYEDIRDAGQLNLQEVATVDLPKFEEFINKIINEKYKYIPSDELYDNGTIRPNLIKKAKELDSNVFTITKNISGGGPFRNTPKQTSLAITMATPKAEPLKQFYIHNTDDQDLEDILDAAEMNLQEVATDDIPQFEEAIEKIVDGGYTYLNISGAEKWMGEDVHKYLIKRGKKDNKKYFYIRDNGQDILMFFPDGQRYPLRGISDDDLQDILDAGKFNKLESKQINEKIYPYPDDILDKIANEGWEHVEIFGSLPRKAAILKELADIHNKKFFTTAYESDKSTDPPMEVVNIFWADGKRSTSRDILDPGSLKDMEDLRDAADIKHSQEDLHEVYSEDVPSFEEVLNKIAENEAQHYKFINNPVYMTRDVIIDRLEDLEKERGRMQFGIAKFRKGYIVFFSDDTSYPLSLDEKDLEDISDAAYGGKLNEAKNHPRFEELLNKIAEGDYYFQKTKSNNIGHLRNLHKFIKDDLKFDNPFFISTAERSDTTDTAFMFSDDPENIFWIQDMTEEDREIIDDTIQTFTKDLNKAIDSRVNESIEFEYDPVHEMAHYEDLMDYMSANGLNIKPYPEIVFVDDDQENGEDLFGKTAYYDPNSRKVVLYTYGRHPKDILRSFAHELVHVHQDAEGRIGNIQTTNTNADEYLVVLEKEAYLKGNMMFRQWTDGIDEDKKKQYGVDAYAAELARLRENKEVKGPNIKKIYCDINEVLADTDTPDLDWTDDGRKLWEYLFTLPIPVTLLSSTSNQEHKEDWIKGAFHKQLQPKVIFRSSGDKHEFSEPGSLLIDNKDSTIDEWREKGGIGILHDNANDTIKELKKYGL